MSPLEAHRSLVEDIESAMADVGMSHKAACLSMVVDPARWTRMRQGDMTLDAAKLALLGDDFQRAFTERRASRFGLHVEEDPDTEKAERLKKLLHALVDAVDVFPMVKAGLAAEQAARKTA